MKLTLAALIGTILFFATPAQANVVRTTSSYGLFNSIADKTPGDGFISSSMGIDQWVVCYSDTEAGPGNCDNSSGVGPTEFDLIVELTSAAALNSDIGVTVPQLSSVTFNSPSNNFGILTCGVDAINGVPCSDASAISSQCLSDMGNTTPTGILIELPGSCATAGMVFYFDETSPELGGPPTSTPEPSSVLLLGLGLVPLAFLSYRRCMA